MLDVNDFSTTPPTASFMHPCSCFASPDANCTRSWLGVLRVPVPEANLGLKQLSSAAATLIRSGRASASALPPWKSSTRSLPCSRTTARVSRRPRRPLPLSRPSRLTRPAYSCLLCYPTQRQDQRGPEADRPQEEGMRPPPAALDSLDSDSILRPRRMSPIS
jgi:hypothetical protein